MASNKAKTSCVPQPCNEDFPPLQTKKDTLKNSNIMFKKFLTVRHQDPEIRMADINPFEVDRKIKSLLGKNHSCKITKLRSGLLLIEVDRKQHYEKLIAQKKLVDIPVVIGEHRQMNSSKGVIYCDSGAIKSMTNEELKLEMEGQGVTEVYRIVKRDGIATNLYILTFSNSTLPKEVKIGYMKADVRLHIPNPRRCFKCQRYGHGQNTCTHETVCATCGQSGHGYNSEDCERNEMCYHCSQEHATTSRNCPMWKLEKSILEVKLKNNMTFQDARTSVYRANPQLVAQIPRLKNQNQKATYTNVVAKTSATEVLQQQIQLQQQQISALNLQIAQLIKALGYDASATSKQPKKRNLGSSSEDEDSPVTQSSKKATYPSVQRDSSSRQEVKKVSAQHTSSLQEVQKQPDPSPPSIEMRDEGSALNSNEVAPLVTEEVPQ